MSTTDQNALDDSTLQIGPLRIENFASLLQDLRTAVDSFQTDSTPQNFAVIITSLQAFGLSGADLWQQAAAYAKRNPMRVAMLAGLAFYAIKGLATSSANVRKMVH